MHPGPTAASLLSQCQQLHSSVQAFQEACNAQYTPVDISSYLKPITSELRALEKLAALPESNSANQDTDSGTEPIATMHTLRSSNLGFFKTVWEMTRRCRHVVALNKREGGSGYGNGKGGMIDVVAEMGLLWVKIVTIGERKLLFEMAKEGWDVGMWDESDSEDYGGPGMDGLKESSHVEPESVLPLVKMVKDLVATSRMAKIHYHHPQLLVYFPNLHEDKISTPAVAKVIATLRATGATIHCGDGEIELPNLPPLQLLPQGLDRHEQMLPKMIPDLTPVLNIDCTILLALISDLSHLSLDANDASNEPLRKQLTGEQARPLLSAILYPALAGHKLITSHLAAQRMRDIVNTLGTPNEKARADIIIGEGPYAEHTAQDLLAHLQKYSDFDVSAEFKLPIEIIDTQHMELPKDSSIVQPILSNINWSVTILGWSKNTTIVTSNRVVAKQIENLIQNAPGDIIGPDMWVIDIARSLVGKERIKRS